MIAKETIPRKPSIRDLLAEGLRSGWSTTKSLVAITAILGTFAFNAMVLFHETVGDAVLQGLTRYLARPAVVSSAEAAQFKRARETALSEARKVRAEASDLRSAIAKLQLDVGQLEADKILLQDQMRAQEIWSQQLTERHRTVTAERDRYSRDLAIARSKSEDLAASKARLQEEFNEVRATSSQLDSQLRGKETAVRQLTQQRDALLSERDEASRIVASLRAEVQKSDAELAVRNGTISRLEEELRNLRDSPPPISAAKTRQVEELTSRMGARITRNAARNIASMPLESTPIVGLLTVGAVTTLEIYDSCQLIKETMDLRELAGVTQPDPGWGNEVCSHVVEAPFDAERLTLPECYELAEKQMEVLGPELGAAVKASVRAYCVCREVPGRECDFAVTDAYLD